MRQGFRPAVCFNQSNDRNEGWVECCLATALQPISRGLHKGAGLKDVITLGRVELRIVGVRHDTAVLAVIKLRPYRWGKIDTGGGWGTKTGG